MEQENFNQEELPSANGWGIFGSFMIPILGIILYFTTKNKVENPGAYLKAAIWGFVIGFLLNIITLVA